jgi:hypothetical protein
VFNQQVGSTQLSCHTVTTTTLATVASSFVALSTSDSYVQV